jgi:hypothetical protein
MYHQTIINNNLHCFLCYSGCISTPVRLTFQPARWQCRYTLRVTSKTLYSPEYIPSKHTQKDKIIYMLESPTLYPGPCQSLPGRPGCAKSYSLHVATNSLCEPMYEGSNYQAVFSTCKNQIFDLYWSHPVHSRPQSHFHSVTRWKLGSGLHDQMERSDWLLREPANYHAH